MEDLLYFFASIKIKRRLHYGWIRKKTGFLSEKKEKEVPLPFHTFTLCFTLSYPKLLHTLLCPGHTQTTGQRSDRAWRQKCLGCACACGFRSSNQEFFRKAGGRRTELYKRKSKLPYSCQQQRKSSNQCDFYQRNAKGGEFPNQQFWWKSSRHRWGSCRSGFRLCGIYGKRHTVGRWLRFDLRNRQGWRQYKAKKYWWKHRYGPVFHENKRHYRLCFRQCRESGKRKLQFGRFPLS